MDQLGTQSQGRNIIGNEIQSGLWVLGNIDAEVQGFA